ncbi:Uncharacterised protein [Chlamydia trachomatis]|nr:Uncharacterised protein [Chlamydia trachomatis]
MPVIKKFVLAIYTVSFTFSKKRLLMCSNKINSIFPYFLSLIVIKFSSSLIKVASISFTKKLINFLLSVRFSLFIKHKSMSFGFLSINPLCCKAQDPFIIILIFLLYLLLNFFILSCKKIIISSKLWFDNFMYVPRHKRNVSNIILIY